MSQITTEIDEGCSTESIICQPRFEIKLFIYFTIISKKIYNNILAKVRLNDGIMASNETLTEYDNALPNT